MQTSTNFPILNSPESNSSLLTPLKIGSDQAFSSQQFKVLHDIPGRCRLRIASLRESKYISINFERRLKTVRSLIISRLILRVTQS